MIHSSCCTVRAHDSQRRSTRSVWRWQRRKVYPNSSTTFYLEPRAFVSQSRTSGERVRSSQPNWFYWSSIDLGKWWSINFYKWMSMKYWHIRTWFADLVCVSSVVTAVYDTTLNFRNNEIPTLLGVLNGKKYHAALYVRYLWQYLTLYFLLCVLQKPLLMYPSSNMQWFIYIFFFYNVNILKSHLKTSRPALDKCLQNFLCVC